MRAVMPDRQNVRRLYAVCGACLAGSVLSTWCGSLLSAVLCAALRLGASAFLALTSVLGYGLGLGALFFLLRHFDRRELLGLSRRPRAGDLVSGAAVPVLFYPMAAFLASLSAFLVPDSVLELGSGGESAMEGLGLPGALLVLCAVPAVFEELLCRGCVYGVLRMRGFVWAAAGSSLIFAALHGNLQQGLYAFAFGLILACLREASGSTVPGMIAHGVFNSFSVIALFLPSGEMGSAASAGAGPGTFPEWLAENQVLLLLGALGLGACILILVNRLGKPDTAVCREVPRMTPGLAAGLAAVAANLILLSL